MARMLTAGAGRAGAVGLARVAVCRAGNARGARQPPAGQAQAALARARIARCTVSVCTCLAAGALCAVVGLQHAGQGLCHRRSSVAGPSAAHINRAAPAAPHQACGAGVVDEAAGLAASTSHHHPAGHAGVGGGEREALGATPALTLTSAGHKTDALGDGGALLQQSGAAGQGVRWVWGCHMRASAPNASTPRGRRGSPARKPQRPPSSRGCR